MKNDFNNFYLMMMVLFLAIGCKNKTEKTKEFSTLKSVEVLAILGNYVSEGYSKRSEGYDWVVVTVTETENNQLNISVRSRADKKKPTCTFDAVAKRVDDQVYQTQIDGKTILVEFTRGKISITTKQVEDEGILYFYCSGGATLGGTYLKIKEILDQSELGKK